MRQPPAGFTKIAYDDLNARQQENFNFQKASAVLAEYGYVTLRLSDDWQGADFIAYHVDGDSFLKVQLKGRLTVDTKYIDKQIWIYFNDGNDRSVWYLFPHDDFLSWALVNTNVGNTKSWVDNGIYHCPSLSKNISYWLRDHALTNDPIGPAQEALQPG